MIAALYASVLGLTAAFALFTLFHWERRFLLYLAVLATSFLILIWLYENSAPDELWRLTVFMGSVLLVIGWIVTNEIAISNSKKQHTITIILELMHNSQRVADKKLIKKYLKTYTTKFVPAMAAFDDEGHELTQAIDRELNFLEFMAAGIDMGDLDGKLADRCLRGIVINTVEQNADYIAFWQARNASTWENLAAYANALKRRR